MKKIRLLMGTLALLGTVILSGCKDMDQVNDSDKNGNLVIRITDAPFPVSMVDSAIVAITKVEIRKLSEGEEIEYPFITIWEGFEEFNLLELMNGKSEELVDIQIEAGKYDLIRLYVDEARLVVKEGDTHHMKVPSGAQTGIKIFMKPPLQVAGGLTTDVLLDFDLSRSFVLKGNTKSPAGIKGFNFKPVIRAVNYTTAGTIEGMVMNSETALENAYVLLEQVVEEDTFEITSAYTNDTGYYAMPGIPAGLYRISATLAEFDTVAFDDLEVIAGNLTVQDFILTKLDEEENSEE